MVVLDVHALSREPPNRELGDAARLVGGIVEHLDFKEIARVIDPADRLDQPIGDVHLVVERELNRHGGKRIQLCARLRLLVSVPDVQIDQVVPMPAVNRENDEYEKINCEGE